MPVRSPLRAAAVSALLAAFLATGCSPGTDDSGTVEPPGARPRQSDVTFRSGPDTLHGTFALPPGGGEDLPAALIVSGSGPTDRDGDNPGRPDAGTNKNFARLLADMGVASLRYDKLGSGETGMASRDDDATVGFGVFAQEVADAYSHLASRPEVDPSRLIVLGHSEGALFALRAHEIVEQHPPRALVLAAPPGRRYLDTLDRQITEQVRRAEAAGSMDYSAADQTLSDMRSAVAAIRDGDELEEADVPHGYGGLFDPRYQRFLRRIDALDPARLARDLPAGTGTLVLWGTADSQIARSDVDRLMTGLPDGERADIPDADHVFRRYSDAPGAEALDSRRRFSPDVAPALRGFLESEIGI
ncbi:alpha/beta hydrolase family protein [Streptomonospora wellingtoniae]|uniref:Alpha/beta fold hydrolase n=1 Tax=Streptomonospora wellingtoniae TaxID=3075544 RepID=A0ABU2KZH9_9ACTN|nr:alpha/beta hydrolase [Streptomonospora sp. DSM 45055]MDT0304715.1 alpha/beta fold hydrolase [Streptomonospora sp. DSM 45055]